MSNEMSITIITPKTLAEARELSSQLAGARTIPDALQKSPADVLAIVMAGAELGLAPMQAIRALVLIKGKPTLSADAMVALVKARKDRCKSFDMVETTATKATYRTVEVGGSPDGTTLSFTIEEAKTAGIAGDMYRKYPAQMLRARAKAALCREVYPDLLLGVYDPEELAPEQDVTPRPSPPSKMIDVTQHDPKTGEVIDVTPRRVDDIEKTKGLALARFETSITEAELEGAWNQLVKPMPDADRKEMEAPFKARRKALRAAAVKPAPTPPQSAPVTVDALPVAPVEANSAADDVPF